MAKPGTWPAVGPRFRTGLDERQVADGDQRPSLGQQVLCPELPLEEDHVRVGVAADAVFRAPEGPTAEKDVLSRRVGIQAGDAVIVGVFTGSVGVGGQPAPRPGPDGVGFGRCEEELDLGGEWAVFSGFFRHRRG